MDTTNKNIYYVIEFTELPYINVEKYVIVPHSWIILHIPNTDKILVAYPTEDSIRTRKRVERNEEYGHNWQLYDAVVKYDSSNIREANIWIEIMHDIDNKHRRLVTEDKNNSLNQTDTYASIQSEHTETNRQLLISNKKGKKRIDGKNILSASNFNKSPLNVEPSKNTDNSYIKTSIKPTIESGAKTEFIMERIKIVNIEKSEDLNYVSASCKNSVDEQVIYTHVDDSNHEPCVQNMIVITDNIRPINYLCKPYPPIISSDSLYLDHNKQEVFQSFTETNGNDENVCPENDLDNFSPIESWRNIIKSQTTQTYKGLPSKVNQGHARQLSRRQKALNIRSKKIDSRAYFQNATNINRISSVRSTNSANYFCLKNDGTQSINDELSAGPELSNSTQHDCIHDDVSNKSQRGLYSYDIQMDKYSHINEIIITKKSEIKPPQTYSDKSYIMPYVLNAVKECCRLPKYLSDTQVRLQNSTSNEYNYHPSVVNQANYELPPPNYLQRTSCLSQEKTSPPEITEIRPLPPFHLPPAYDPNDTRWTLKHQQSAPGLVELMPHTGVYINAWRFDFCLQIATNYKTLACMLLTEIFSLKALRVCSLTGAMCTTRYGLNEHIRPGLDKHARTVLLNFVKGYGTGKNWGESNTQSILGAIRNKIYKLRYENDANVSY